MEPADKQTSPFWWFSLRLYGERDFAGACLALQDRHGVDVNVLLFLLWAAQNGRRIEEEGVGAILAAVDAWHRSVVAPLRTARRYLRTPPADVQAGPAAALRQRIQEAELEAERLQQEMLYRLFPMERRSQPEPFRDAFASVNLKSYAAVLGTEFPAPLIDALLKVFLEYSRAETNQSPGS
jgi:uncharacterized protein (TIGR02444 family)